MSNKREDEEGGGEDQGTGAEDPNITTGVS